jgi:hypothetical protein
MIYFAIFLGYFLCVRNSSGKMADALVAEIVLQGHFFSGDYYLPEMNISLEHTTTNLFSK